MSIPIMQSLAALLTSQNLTTGYEIKYLRWTDADVNGSTPFIMFRMAGSGGETNREIQRPDIRIIIVNNPAEVQVLDARIRAIAAYLRGAVAGTNVYKFEPIGQLMVPFYFDNGRPAYELNVRAFVSNN